MTDWDDVDQFINDELEKVLKQSNTYKSALKNLQNFKNRLKAAIRQAERKLKINQSEELLEVINYFESAILQVDSAIIQAEELYDTRDQWIPILKDKVNSRKQNYINWLKSDESLEQFINTLQEQNLIEARDTKAIINNHFKPVREQNSKPEPIKWLDTQKLLVYLFRNLYKKYFINPAGKKWQLLSEHFVKSNGEQYKIRSLTQEAHSQKDGNLPANGKAIIDKIIDRLIAG